MAKTTADLVERVLVELRILAAGETPSAEDSALIIADYDAAVQELETRGIAAWPSASIPDRFFLPLVRYIAAVVAPAFGREYMDVEAAHRGLRAVTAKPYTGADAELNYL